MAKFLRFGPEQPNPGRKTCWIALVNKDVNTQIGGDFLVGRECQFITEIQSEVDQIKADLDEILREAKKRFGASN